MHLGTQGREALLEKKNPSPDTTNTWSGDLPGACLKRKLIRNVYARVRSESMIASHAIQTLSSSLYIAIAMYGHSHVLIPRIIVSIESNAPYLDCRIDENSDEKKSGRCLSQK